MRGPWGVSDEEGVGEWLGGSSKELEGGVGRLSPSIDFSSIRGHETSGDIVRFDI